MNKKNYLMYYRSITNCKSDENVDWLCFCIRNQQISCLNNFIKTHPGQLDGDK